jgi:hypothetical protein
MGGGALVTLILPVTTPVAGLHGANRMSNKFRTILGLEAFEPRWVPDGSMAASVTALVATNNSPQQITADQASSEGMVNFGTIEGSKEIKIEVTIFYKTEGGENKTLTVTITQNGDADPAGAAAAFERELNKKGFTALRAKDTPRVDFVGPKGSTLTSIGVKITNRLTGDELDAKHLPKSSITTSESIDKA